MWIYANQAINNNRRIPLLKSRSLSSRRPSPSL